MLQKACTTTRTAGPCMPALAAAQAAPRTGCIAASDATDAHLGFYTNTGPGKSTKWLLQLLTPHWPWNAMLCCANKQVQAVMACRDFNAHGCTGCVSHPRTGKQRLPRHAALSMRPRLKAAARYETYIAAASCCSKQPRAALLLQTTWHHLQQS